MVQRPRAELRGASGSVTWNVSMWDEAGVGTPQPFQGEVLCCNIRKLVVQLVVAACCKEASFLVL